MRIGFLCLLNTVIWWPLYESQAYAAKFVVPTETWISTESLFLLKEPVRFFESKTNPNIKFIQKDVISGKVTPLDCEEEKRAWETIFPKSYSITFVNKEKQGAKYCRISIIGPDLIVEQGIFLFKTGKVQRERAKRALTFSGSPKTYLAQKPLIEDFFETLRWTD